MYPTVYKTSGKNADLLKGRSQSGTKRVFRNKFRFSKFEMWDLKYFSQWQLCMAGPIHQNLQISFT